MILINCLTSQIFVSYQCCCRRYISSWIETREAQSERANLTILFDKYVPACLEAIRSRFKKVTPVVDISHLHMLCSLLECILTPDNTPHDCPKEWYELYFVFCCVWAFGGCLFQDQVFTATMQFHNDVQGGPKRHTYCFSTIQCVPIKPVLSDLSVSHVALHKYIIF